MHNRFGIVAISVFLSVCCVRCAASAGWTIDTSTAMPLGSYKAAAQDRAAADMVVSEIKTRYPQISSEMQFAAVAAYWIYNRNYNPPNSSLPTIAAEINDHSGSCGQQSVQLGEVLSAVGIPHRLRQFYNLKQPALGHTAVEAFIDGKWIYLDSTLGSLFVKGDWKNFDSRNFLSWEKASDPKNKAQGLMFRHLMLTSRKFLDTEYAFLRSILGKDPYNGVLHGDLSQLFSTEPPDAAMREMLALFKANTLDFLRDNSGVAYSCKASDSAVCPVFEAKITLDVSELTSHALGTNNYDSEDYRWEVNDGRAANSPLHFLGLLSTYFDQYVSGANAEITLDNIPSAGGKLVIWFWRPKNTVVARVNAYDVSVVPRKLLATKWFDAGQSQGQLVIATDRHKKTIRFEMKVEGSSKTEDALMFDSINFLSNITDKRDDLDLDSSSFVKAMRGDGYTVVIWDKKMQEQQFIFKPPVKGSSAIFARDNSGYWTKKGDVPDVFWDYEFIPWKARTTGDVMIFKGEKDTSAYGFNGKLWYFITWIGLPEAKMSAQDCDDDGVEELVFDFPDARPQATYRLLNGKMTQSDVCSFHKTE